MEIIKVISFQHLAISKPFQKLSRNNSFRVRREIFLPEKAVEYFKMFQYYKIGKSLKKMLYPLRNFFYKKICTLQFKLSTQYSLIFRLFKNPILCQLLSKSTFNKNHEFFFSFFYQLRQHPCSISFKAIQDFLIFKH